MKRDNHSDFEKDPVWELLRESAAKRPSPNFASNVLRAARLEGQEQVKPWWKSFLIPLSAGTALAGAAALVAVVMSMQSAAPQGRGPDRTAEAPIPKESSLAALEDTAQTEVFLTACENLGAYKDEELVSMIGF
ncbi:hypothetical protein [Haloferula sp. BvORR071]|uniref:hypothetical protein n=1 Tax=Haloferula sp. BvORR071 TaxID=1396141 RepID=UPI000559301E|nr:hypothetical protein [Haloferula sp. BvORR071]